MQTLWMKTNNIMRFITRTNISNEEILKLSNQDFFCRDSFEDPIQCLHDSCGECGGCGKKKDGSMCIHFISCACPKCTPRY
jgi:hypothetical protein